MAFVLGLMVTIRRRFLTIGRRFLTIGHRFLTIGRRFLTIGHRFLTIWVPGCVIESTVAPSKTFL